MSLPEMFTIRSHTHLLRKVMILIFLFEITRGSDMETLINFIYMTLCSEVQQLLLTYMT
jgi:hypothetical protein